MVVTRFVFFIVVAITAVCARPFDVFEKDDGSLKPTLHEKLQKHFHDVDLPGGFKIGGSVSKSHAAAESIASNYGKGSLTAAAAHSSSLSFVKNDDHYHKHGDHISSAKGDATSEAGHYGKGHHYPSKTASLAKSAAAAESSAADYHKPSAHSSLAKAAAAADAVSADLKTKGDYKHAPHFFYEKPHGDDPHAYNVAEAKAAAEAASYGKKGASHAVAESQSKAVSYGGKGKSVAKSSAAAESSAVAHHKDHYFNDEHQGDDPHVFTFSHSNAASEAVSHGKNGDSHAVAESDSKAVSSGGKGKSVAKSSAVAESSSTHHYKPEARESLAKASAAAEAVSKSHDEPKNHHYFNDQPQGDDPYAASSAKSKASAEAVSYGKKGASYAVAQSESKAVSYGGKGKSLAKSAAAAESAVVGHHKGHYLDKPLGDDPHAFNLAASKAAAESLAFGKKGHAAADSEASGKYYKGSSLASSLTKAESFSGHGISSSSAAAKSISISAS